MDKKHIAFGLLLLSAFALAPSHAFAHPSPDGKPHLERGDLREDFKASVEARREERKAEHQVKKQAFKTELSNLKDKKIQQKAANIDARLADLNTKRTDKMTLALNKFNEILNRLVTETDQAKAAGKDTAAADTALVAAQGAIMSAKEEVTAQAGTIYTTQVPEDTLVKPSFQKTFTLLKSDLEIAHTSVKAAKAAIKAAFLEVAKLKSMSNNESEGN